MFLRLLWLLSKSGQELRMAILVLLLGLIMLKRYLLVNPILPTSAAMRGFIKAFKQRANKG